MAVEVVGTRMQKRSPEVITEMENRSSGKRPSHGGKRVRRDLPTALGQSCRKWAKITASSHRQTGRNMEADVSPGRQCAALEENSLLLFIVIESCREICFLTESWQIKAGCGWGYLKLLIPNKFLLKNKSKHLNCQEQSYSSIWRRVGEVSRAVEEASSIWDYSTGWWLSRSPPTQRVTQGPELKSSLKRQRTSVKNLLVRRWSQTPAGGDISDSEFLVGLLSPSSHLKIYWPSWSQLIICL